jgi:hypothetical protein
MTIDGEPISIADAIEKELHGILPDGRAYLSTLKLKPMKP